MSAPDTVNAAAWRLHQHGYVVVPKLAGDKRPALASWKDYQRTHPTDEQMHIWFDQAQPDGLCIITGAISGNLEMLELEGRAVTDGTLQQFEQAIKDAGLGECFGRICAGLAENSPSGGIHWLYRVEGTPVLGNTKLASAPDRAVLVETRGEGGLTVAAPSTGHPKGGAWSYRYRSVGLPAVITADEYKRLHAAARSLDRAPARKVQESVASRERIGAPRVPKQRSAGEITPWDDYNQRGPDWGELLPDWELVRGVEGDGECHWRRPGDTTALHSATTNHDGNNYLYVWSSSTEFEPETPLTKFGVYAQLHHDGDVSAAAKALRERGFGTPPQAKNQGHTPGTWQQKMMAKVGKNV